MSIADLSPTPGSNLAVNGQSIQGSANANTIDSMFQATAALLAQFYDDLGGTGTVGGTADAITLASGSTFASLATGLVVAFKAGATNTGAATINVDTLGAKAIRKQGDAALGAGNIVSGGVYVLRYDADYNSSAGAWVLLNQTETTTGGMTVVATDTVNSGSTWTVTNIPSGYKDLEIVLIWLSFTSGSDTLKLEYSVNNGSSWAGPFEVSAPLGNAGDRFGGSIRIIRAGSNVAYKVIQSMMLDTSETIPALRSHVSFAVTGVVNAIRLSGGTFDGAGGPVEVRTIN